MKLYPRLIYLAAVSIITLTFMSCSDNPWMGSIVTPPSITTPTLDDYLTIADDQLCFEDGTGSSCVRLIPQVQEDPLKPLPHIHLHTGKTIYVFYRDGVPVVRAVRHSPASGGGGGSDGHIRPAASGGGAVEEPQSPQNPVFDAPAEEQQATLDPVFADPSPVSVNPGNPDPQPISDPDPVDPVNPPVNPPVSTVTTPVTTPVDPVDPNPDPDPVTTVTTRTTDPPEPETEEETTSKWVIFIYDVHTHSSDTPSGDKFDHKTYCESLTVTDQNGNKLDIPRADTIGYSDPGSTGEIQLVIPSDATKLIVTGECEGEPVEYQTLDLSKL